MAGRRLVAAGVVVGLAAISTGGFFSAASAAPGDLDPTFGGGDGIVSQTLSPPGRGNKVAVQPDGKIVALTQLASAAGFDTLVRFNADGTLDTGFGTGGTAEVGRGSGTTRDVAVMSDGSIVAVGLALGGRSVGIVHKFTPAGLPDTSFGDPGGSVLVNPTTLEGSTDIVGVFEEGGRIVAVGSRDELLPGGSFITSGVVAMRLLADGAPDLSYGPGGQQWSADQTVGTVERFEAVGIAPQPDGSVLVAAETRLTGGNSLWAYRVGPGAAIALLNGAEEVGGAAGGDFLSAAPLLGGGMVVGGIGVQISPGSPEPIRVLQTVTAAGERGGQVVEPSVLGFQDLALLSNGTIAAAVSDEEGTGGAVEVRTSAGALDPAFAGDGVAEGLVARGVAPAPGATLVAVGGVSGATTGTLEVRRYEGGPGRGGGPVPLVPERILDTRTGIGHSGPKPGADSTIRVVVAGRGGVPATGAAAVVLNVTATEADAPGFVTVWPTGLPRPNASNLNISGAGQTIPNLVTVPLGADGSVSMFNYGGSHLIADAAAWFPSGGGFVPLTPDRILDTRTGIGHTGPKPGAGATVDLRVVDRGGVASDATAVVLNVTATETDGPGFVTVWPAGGPRPNASNVNISRAGESIPNQVYVPVGASGSVSLFTYDGSHLLADVAGYFTAAGAFHPLTPDRILDTRPAAGPIGYAGSKPVAGDTVAVRVAGVGGVPATGATAVVMNVTATEAAGPGFVTAWPSGQARPNASNLNLDQAGQTIANLVVVPIGPDGTVNLFTYDGAHLVADVAGWIG